MDNALGPRVISVVLNHDRREDTLACLGSLAASRYANHRAIVLDSSLNGSCAEAVHAGFPQAEVIRLQDNRGYAGNNNVGIKAAIAGGADWIFVLNEDTILDPGCLSHLVAAGESAPDIGIVGPTVYHHDEPNIIQSAGGVIGRYWESIHLAKNEPDQNQFQGLHAVDWISGCAIMVRRQVIEQAGAIDERYFYYWEETEWCIRAAKSGWRVMHVPQAKIWHKGVQREYRPKAAVTYYATRNRLLTLAKHRAPVIAWLAAYLQIIRTLTSWTVRPRWQSMRAHRHAMWRGLVDFLYQRWGGPVKL